MASFESIVTQNVFNANTDVFDDFRVASCLVPDRNHVIAEFEGKDNTEHFTTFNQVKLLANQPKEKFFPVLGSV